MEVWRIAKWDKAFENAESKRVENLTWVKWPIGLDSAGFDALIEEFGEEAPSIYGAWCALVCVAAKCHVRGTLADSKGRPHTVSRLAIKTHFPASVFTKLIAWASSEGVAWLELATDLIPNRLEIESESGLARQAFGLDEDETKTRGDGDMNRPSVRPLLSDATEIVVDEDGWKLIAATTLRIARVVTKNPNVELQRLASGDRRLCIRAAALAEWRYGADWLNEILEKLSDRTTKLDSPWGYFRNSLKISIAEQFGEVFREVEKYVQNRIGKRPAEANP